MRTGMVVTPASLVNRMLKSTSVSVLSAGSSGLHITKRRCESVQDCITEETHGACYALRNTSLLPLLAHMKH